jgi:hypothetical protein
VPGVSVDRYPTWPFLAAAFAAALAVVVLYMRLDRGANPRSVYLKLLLAWLVVAGAAALGLLVTRTGQRIAPNEGLLVFTDIMVSLIVIAIPIFRATRRLTVSELRQIRGPTALTDMFGLRRSIALVALMIGTIVVLLAGEIALADRLPGPPALVACQDYTTWSIFTATGVGPQPKPGILKQAAEIAPRGALRDSLDALVADLREADSGRGTTQAEAATNVLSDETTLYDACRPVLAAAG